MFAVDHTMYVHLHAYERDEPGAQQARSGSAASMPSTPLFAYVSFYRDQKMVMETAPIAVTPEPYTRLGIVPLKFQVPLGKLVPGPYQCQVTVLDPAVVVRRFGKER